MRIDKLIEGLNILAKYEAEGNVEPGHDEIWGPGPSSDKMTPEDKVRLEELHWMWDEESEGWFVFT